ncbi:MAG: hypothetical protein IJF73_05475 [Clostridia bacterium]|nr:hypothetical protein [Clostridia bacterium]
MPRRERLSKTSAYHYVKLAVRSLMLIAATVFYILGHVRGVEQPLSFLTRLPWLLLGIFLAFAIEIFLRFFPSSIESMGCQKQFRRNYVPTEEMREMGGRVRLGTWRSTLAVAGAWVALNGIIAALYYTGVLDAGILVLIALFYSVADMICILFFCPFQTWFMRNKCCGSCRIYNWDYVMMFTPLVLIPNLFTIGLFALALVLVIVWEILVLRHPERFSEATNATLRCAHCKEKLCHHKRQLRAFLKKNAEKIRLRENLELAKERARRLLRREKTASPPQDDRPPSNGAD